MGNSKLYAKTDDDFEGLQCTVKRFSDDTEMQFSLDKCAKVRFKKGLLICYKNHSRDKHRNYRVRTQ